MPSHSVELTELNSVLGKSSSRLQLAASAQLSSAQQAKITLRIGWIKVY